MPGQTELKHIRLRETGSRYSFQRFAKPRAYAGYRVDIVGETTLLLLSNSDSKTSTKRPRTPHPSPPATPTPAKIDKMSRGKVFPTRLQLRPAKNRISLYIHPVWFLIWVYTICPGLSVLIYTINTVCLLELFINFCIRDRRNLFIYLTTYVVQGRYIYLR